MPLEHILNNKLNLYKYPFNLTDETIDKWEFWKWQMYIEKINKSNKDKKSDSAISDDYMKNVLGIK